MASRRNPSTAQAELVFLPNLKNCLLNLPAALVAVLLNTDTVAQNVIVELTYRSSPPPSSDPKQRASSGGVQKSVFLGWTGMQSQTKLAPVVGRDGFANSGRNGGRSEQDVATVEVDAGFGRLLGLTEGMKVGVALHLDPPLAHTVNIEPVTATDWEIIELHARFLEMNFLSQVRALPNPAAGFSHPIILHLTPTSTAHILVSSLTPAPTSTQPFVKISPDAEVIVAPRLRQQVRPGSARDNRSITSTSRRSAGGQSTKGTARHRSTHDDEKARPPLFLRGVTRALQNEWFEDGDDEMNDEGLKIWLDREHLLSKTLRGVSWVAVTVIKPAGLQEQSEPQAQSPPDQLPAAKVVASLCAWEDAPDARHVALSSLLCSTLSCSGLVGGIVRIDPAPTPLPKTASAMKEPSQQASKDAIVKRLRITPFLSLGSSSKTTTGFKFGGESKSEKEESALRIKAMFGKTLLDGPLTDGMLIPKEGDWTGGVLDFDPSPPGDPSKSRTNWLVGSERKLEISVQAATAPPKLPAPSGELIPDEEPVMVGVDALTKQTRSSLLHMSSVLLTGSLGCGKSSLAHLLAHQLQREFLFNVVYFPCRKLVTDETRVKTVKDMLQRVFASAAWGARYGGKALVILDDIDKLCPVEQELQMDANGRSRQISELLCGIVREHCGRDSGVVLLATAQSKEAVHNVIIGGHVVRDIIALKAPDKDGRRKVLDMLVRQAASKSHHAVQAGVDINGGAANEWMDGSDDGQPNAHAEEDPATPAIDPNLDLLDIAGQTDGYMPGDLTLLVSRARSEALIRVVTDSDLSDDITLTAEDFTAALKGFTPASLRGVTLHSSTTTFKSIGGLRETRQVLLETLQYPTTYAPLFSQCPLRLRSGLLLYGYPGCGKTLLASAVAGECGLNFISVKGPEILNKYIGASEKSVRDLFERAEAAKPCVLFFDEFDSIAPKRGHDSTGVTDRVVNMLLTMMDGAEGLSGVYVLAATSRPDLIDPALLRPGRLDKSLICDLPDFEDRVDILRAIAAKLVVDASLLEAPAHAKQSLEEIARMTEGYSGADLQAILYNAHLEAIHDLLGPGDTGAQEMGAKRKTNGSNGRGGGGKGQDFTYFRLGDDKLKGENDSSTQMTAATAATAAAERAQIAAKLAAMQLARRKARQERHANQQQQQQPNRPGSRPGSSNGMGPRGQHQQQPNGFADDQSSKQQQQQHQDPVISWRHLQKSLASTRSSISVQDRRRLAAIYREFVVGRNGEMSDGQGSSEIGGRTSLM